MNFWKYQGAGNDFVMLDQRAHQWVGRADTARIERLCDRRFGIGADGLILLQNLPGYDFEMIYFNADGRESTMCGNGGRCIAAFAQHLGVVGERCRFRAIDGEHEAIVSSLLVGEGQRAGSGLWVELKMTDVQTVEKQGEAYILNTGSPHYVRFENDLENLDMVAQGQAVRYSERWKKEGINVNLVAETAAKPCLPAGRRKMQNAKSNTPLPTGEGPGASLQIRTYERGVEDETYACGTGVTAAAIASFLERGGSAGDFEIAVHAKGGELAVRFHANGDGSFSNIWLCGPAVKVFEGII
ncbi:MAG: diaminopimelate epimerase [Saprospiraceae bacterium]